MRNELDENPKKMGEKLKEEYEKMGPEINANKSKFMCNIQENIPSILLGD